MHDWAQISQWRKMTRAELIDRRRGFEPDERRRDNAVITQRLVRGFPALAGKTIAFCWPYKGEVDVRFAIRHFLERGARAAMPAVVDPNEPLEFRLWWPGAAMEPGVLGIPIPVETEVVSPDVAIVPMNGFDEQGYRLGYGGGYFDRTLAALDRRLLAIGVSFEALRLPTIYPQSHDIPMNFLVTEAAIYQVRREGLRSITEEECASLAPEPSVDRKPEPETRGTCAKVPAEAPGYSSPPCYAHEFAADYFEELATGSTDESMTRHVTLLDEKEPREPRRDRPTEALLRVHLEAKES